MNSCMLNPLRGDTMWVKVPLDIVAIKQDLEDLLGVKVDVVTIYSLSPYMRDEVLKEAVNI